MSDNLDKFASVYEGINHLRDQTVDIGSAEGKELYMVLQSKLHGMKEDEIDIKIISPEVMYWWVITVRDISYDDFVVRYLTPITVSLTSYPERIKYVSPVIRSMIDQSKKPDRILLYLAESQFPGKMDDLDDALREDINQGRCEVRWCEDLKPHKKYFFSFQEIKEGVIITVDDDLKYSQDLIELLHLSYIRHPRAVSASRTHLMAISEDGLILPYHLWIPETDYLLDTPCMQLMSTGAGGVLFPVGIFSSSLFDLKGIKSTCLYADDLWLKCHEVIDHIPTVVACRRKGLSYLEGSQDGALWKYNQNENDRQLQNIMKYIYETEHINANQQLFMDKSYQAQIGVEEYGRHALYLIEFLKGRISRTNAEIERANQRNSVLTGEKEKLQESLRESRVQISDLKKKNEAVRKEKEEVRRECDTVRRENDAVRRENEVLRNETILLRNSRSYRLGNILLKPASSAKKVLKHFLKN